MQLASQQSEHELAGKPRGFSLWQKISLGFISTLGYLAVRLIGPTLRISIFHDPDALQEPRSGPAIYSFWHRCVFSAAYLYRNHGIAVLTSRSYDGEYIARIIEKFGFKAIRGSSSRGALAGMREMQQELQMGNKVAFTVDGPRGPRYVAKPGPIVISKSSGADIISFYVAARRVWTLNSWDQFMIPKPFSPVTVYYSAPLRVPGNANDQTQRDYLQRMQAELERVQREAEARLT